MDIIKQKQEVEKDLLGKDGVVSVGIARKIVKGKKTKEFCISIGVNKKKPLSEIPKDQIIPKEMNGLKTDIVEEEEVKPLLSNPPYTDRTRPLNIGLSAVHYDGTACTIGVPVTKGGKKYALTNLHCACPWWNGALLGDEFIQPSPYDGGSSPTDSIGEVSEIATLILGDPDNLDSAIVELDYDFKPKSLLDVEFLRTTHTPTIADIDKVVEKEGRTTGYTKSTIDAIDVTINVGYGGTLGTVAVPHCIRVINTDDIGGGSFIDSGDSGSAMWLEAAGGSSECELIGQVFAQGTYAYANELQRSLDEFSVSLYTEESNEKSLQYSTVATTTVTQNCAYRLTTQFTTGALRPYANQRSTYLDNGGTFKAWGTPTNAYLSDGSYATGEVGATPNVGVHSWYTFKDFDGSQTLLELLPTDVTIVGIEVTLEGAKADGLPQNIIVYLTKDAGVSVSGSKGTGDMTTSDADYVLGGNDDLWSQSWSRTDFGSNFGVVLIPVYATAGRDVSVDAIKLEVHYIEKTEETIQKDLEYSVVTEDKAEKDLGYSIKSDTTVIKSLAYDIFIPWQRRLKYCVESTPSAEEKSLAYSMFLGSEKVEKSLQYSAIPSPTIQKSLWYNAALPILVKIAPKTTSATIETAESFNDLILWDSLRIRNNIYSRADDCRFTYTKYGSSSYVPESGDEVGVWNYGVKIFGGEISYIKKNLDGKLLTFDIECKDWTDKADRLLVTEEYSDKTVNYIINDLVTTYASDFDITNVDCSTVIDGVVFDNIPLSQCLDKLAELTGYYWLINAEKEMYFFVEGTLVAPYEVTDDNGIVSPTSLEIGEDSEQLINSVKIVSPSITTATVEDATSIASYGTYQTVIRNDQITSTDEATQVGEGFLERHKDPRFKCRFQTVQRRFFAGQKVHVDSTQLDNDHYYIIQSVSFRTRTPTEFNYDIDAAEFRDKDIVDYFKKEVTNPLPDFVESFGNVNWTANIEFTPINQSNLSWGAGEIIMSSGETYSIAANTFTFGVPANPNICYFCPDTSTTELQFSETFADGIGEDRIALGYTFPGTVAESCQFVPITFMGGVKFSGNAHILARSIIADQIAANTITANELIKTAAIITESAQIDDLVVTNAKIANLSVDSLKLAGSAVTTDKIGDGEVTNVKINDMTVSKLTAGNLNVEMNLTTGGSVKSNNYSAGTAGWKIDYDGSAEFGSLTGRGTIRTANEGSQRVELRDMDETDGNELAFYDSTDTYLGGIYWETVSDMLRISSLTGFDFNAYETGSVLQFWSDMGDLISDFNIHPAYAGLQLGDEDGVGWGGLFLQSGFLKLAQMTGAAATTAGSADAPDGSMYYRTDGTPSNVVRVKLNGTWYTVSTS